MLEVSPRASSSHKNTVASPAALPELSSTESQRIIEVGGVQVSGIYKARCDKISEIAGDEPPAGYYRALKVRVQTAGCKVLEIAMPMVTGERARIVECALSSLRTPHIDPSTVSGAKLIISAVESILGSFDDQGASQADWRKEKRGFLMLMRERLLSDAMISDLQKGLDPISLLTPRAAKVAKARSRKLKKILLRDCVGFTAGETLCLTEILRREGHGVEPIDFRGIRHLGDAPCRDGTPYKRKLVWQLLEGVAHAHNISNFSGPVGFNELLRFVSQKEFNSFPLTKRGATFSVLLRQCYGGSPAAAVLDIVHNDPRLARIKRKGIAAYDFRVAPQNTWTDGRGQPTEAARDLVEIYLKAVGRKIGIRSITNVDGFREVLKQLGKAVTIDDPITYWGTTLRPALSRAYGESLSAGILDLVTSRKRYNAVASADLRDFTLPRAAARGSIVEGGLPTAVARLMVRRCITNIAARHGLEPTSVDGFRKVLHDLRARDLNGPIDEWGRKPTALLRDAYKGSSVKAVLDLINHDPDFSKIQRMGVAPYDFHRCRPGYWTSNSGESPGVGARLVADLLFKTVAGHRLTHIASSAAVFREVVEELLLPSAYLRPLNIWGTTALRCLRHGYGGDRVALLRDLVRADGRYGFAAQWVDSSLLRAND